jgi:LmbE family N-acetylglucosaminyl deacetylase
MTVAPAEPPSGNTARLAAQPLPGGGTPTHVWLSGRRELPVLDLAGCAELVVVAAHPDDETLGFGATSAMLAAMGVAVAVVSASDGGASHPRLSRLQRDRLEHLRRAELHCAVSALGLSEPISLGLPDERIADHEDRLADLLTEILHGRAVGTWCAATWCGDGHPDHEAVGRAAAVAAQRTGAALLEYPVWMWHWAYPDDPAVPWDRAYRSRLHRWAVSRKRRAAQCFSSQFEPVTVGSAPVLPPAVVQRLLAVGEVVFR